MDTEKAPRLIKDSLNETIAQKVQAAREELEARNKQQLDDERIRSQQIMLDLYQVKLKRVAEKRFNIPEIAFSRFTSEEFEKVEENVLAFAKKSQRWHYVAKIGCGTLVVGCVGLFVGVIADPVYVLITALSLMACGLVINGLGQNKCEPELFEIARELGKLPKPGTQKAIETTKDREGW